MRDITYASVLLRFISSYEIAPNNELVLNTLDKEAEFVSRFYTPRLRVSELASQVLKDIEGEKIKPVNRDPAKDSFLEKVLKGDLKVEKPNLYQIAKIIMLEVFSVVYLVDNKPGYAQYLSEQDIRQARMNVKYFLDAISGEDKYLELVEHLHNFDISLGYIQGQIPVLKGEVSNG